MSPNLDWDKVSPRNTTSSDMEDDSDTGLSFCDVVNHGDSDEEEVFIEFDSK